MPAIYPVAATRVSEMLLHKRLLSQFEYDRSELLRLQDQVSTGYQYSTPSADAPSALRAVTLQRILEQKEQAKSNLATSESYISATENALSGVSGLLSNIRGQALTAVNTISSQEQRDILAEEVGRVVEQLTTIGNRQFRGRYLFSGSDTAESPFELVGPYIVYRGNENELQSYVDVGFLSKTNVTGAEVFGAISPQVRSTVDLNPVLTESTRLSDLRAGSGIEKGSFVISDGSSAKTIDITNAETIGDVADLIEANPPDGRSITVHLSNFGLIVDIDDALGGNLTIREVAGGTTAAQLGIATSHGTGVTAVVGTDLDPILRQTTRLTDILGTRAKGNITSASADNDLIMEAVENGVDLNGVEIHFIHDVAAGDQASVSYDEVAGRINIDISPHITSANTVVDAVNASGLITARLDTSLDQQNDGSGAVEFSATTTLSGGSGIVFDKNSGIQIENAGETHTVGFEDAETIEDVLNILNTSEAQVLATINDTATGIDVRSLVSGADFAIGENGGTTATELGIRTFSRETALSELNYGQGVEVTDGMDFVVHRRDGVELSIDISDAVTIGDVLDRINHHLLNVGDAVVARLATHGNGIEIYDDNAAATADLKITRGLSAAARDLGLMERTENETFATNPTYASVSLSFPVPNNANTAMELTATQTGFEYNDIEVVFVDTLAGDVANVTFDAANEQLTIAFDASATTTNTVLAAVNAEGTFSGVLDKSVDTANDGSGSIGTPGPAGLTVGGSTYRIAGEDTAVLETEGTFNSLLRLREALKEFNLGEIERTVAMLDDDFQRLNFTRSDLGARASTLDAIRIRVENEELEMKSTLSDELDTDLVEAASDLASRQANMQATLQMIGQTLQLSVLDFL